MLSFLFYKICKNDLKNFIIPDEFSLAIAAVGLGTTLASSEGLLSRIILAELIFILSGLVCGMGDAKLLAALALLLGSSVWFVLLSSFLLCAVYCIFALAFGNLCLRDRIAFSPFIASPALTAFIFMLLQSFRVIEFRP